MAHDPVQVRQKKVTKGTLPLPARFGYDQGHALTPSPLPLRGRGAIGRRKAQAFTVARRIAPRPRSGRGEGVRA